jgi:serine/threonine-protein kinase
MMWVQGPPGVIYVLYDSGRFQRYDDTYNSTADPVSGGETPPNGKIEPVRGFGKVWRSSSDIRNGLGWGLSAEEGTSSVVQFFDRGQMVALSPRGQIIILAHDPGGITGTWRGVNGSF